MYYNLALILFLREREFNLVSNVLLLRPLQSKPVGGVSVLPTGKKDKDSKDKDSKDKDDKNKKALEAASAQNGN